MIDDGYFGSKVMLLARIFGEKNYPIERVKIIYKEVKNLSPQWLDKTVNEFIGSLRQAPLLDEFRKAASEEKYRIASIKPKEQTDSESSLCKKCGDKGYYLKFIQKLPYAFRCTCDSGIKRQAYPLEAQESWDQEFFK